MQDYKKIVDFATKQKRGVIIHNSEMDYTKEETGIWLCQLLSYAEIKNRPVFFSGQGNKEICEKKLPVGLDTKNIPRL